MIEQEMMTIHRQRQLAERIYELTLEGEMVKSMNEPGQFIHIKVTTGLDPLLRRPISIAAIDQEKNQVRIIYRAEGKGTKLLAEKLPGEKLDVLGPLGNGFPIDETKKGETALLVGGGIGVPPLYELAKRLNEKGVQTIHVLGFESSRKAFYKQEFSRFGRTEIATVDGTMGTKGFVTNILDGDFPHFDVLYACGPTPMLSALQERYSDKRAYLSFEQRMGCGIGACFACVCHTTDGANETDYVKVCSDGPVFPIGKVVI